ncbi:MULTISPECIES: molybdenum cofactor guanylyltransferase [unclassified Cryobacterium]|uniref:molybdenum cofactor guanylyltransferase n=1 Tax=unclassified Cryobacterium TaxID=2649013 RepID=UPI002AB4F3F6|nr:MULTISPECIES: NTP transferase domain-containing protein [unclassified Cryobacterium]MDY7543501.1 NTP transferase domain-containing protein [Cryobacterium sp. 5B3]MEA9999742.1 NTP transferase domain-containing protein [Cryobacterium sp. RTS3]MEB0266240.1 NTP transferase domain-containing protein [Cryobacterium sp. 10I5]MEB0273141.1 NTP transferase domain-containing protein [Cryobacterium sp. 5B3]
MPGPLAPNEFDGVLGKNAPEKSENAYFAQNLRRIGSGPAATGPIDLIVLAGGRGSRLGGAVKPAVEVAGRTLLSRVLDARTLARRVVIVGPASARSAAGPEATGALWALEDPPFGGPVAGIAAGLAALARSVPAPASEAGPAPASTAPVPAEWLLVLACDLPWAAAAAGTLVAALADQALADRAGTNTSGTDALDGLHLSDPDGHPQWLAGLYRASALRNAAARLGPRADGASMRALLAGLRLVGVADETGSGRDVDTWEDVEWSTALLSGPSPISTTPPRSETE